LNRYILSRKNNGPFFKNYCKILNKTVKDVKDYFRTLQEKFDIKIKNFEHLKKETGEQHSPEQTCPLL
jgi:hypothetical protein